MNTSTDEQLAQLETTIQDQIQRVRMNAMLARLGVGVGTREQRWAVYQEQKTQADNLIASICWQAKNMVVRFKPHYPKLQFFVRQAIHNPELLDFSDLDVT